METINKKNGHDFIRNLSVVFLASILTGIVSFTCGEEFIPRLSVNFTNDSPSTVYVSIACHYPTYYKYNEMVDSLFYDDNTEMYVCCREIIQSNEIKACNFKSFADQNWHDLLKMGIDTLYVGVFSLSEEREEWIHSRNDSLCAKLYRIPLANLGNGYSIDITYSK